MDDRFKEFRHKIIRVKAALNAAPCDAWINERSQRRAILARLPLPRMTFC